MVTVAKFSISEYRRMIKAGILINRSVKLIDGVIIKMLPCSPEHSSYSGNLADKFRDWLESKALVKDL